MKCEKCSTETKRLFEGKCNRCLCKVAIEDALEEEIGEEDSTLALGVNNPLTPFEYINTVKGLEMLNWKSFIN